MSYTGCLERTVVEPDGAADFHHGLRGSFGAVACCKFSLHLFRRNQTIPMEQGFLKSIPVKIGLVGPSLEKLGGQSIQLHQLRQRLASRSDLEIAFLPVDPRLPAPLRWLQKIRYLRTVVNSIAYVTSLLFAARGLDILHVFCASYASFALVVPPALLIGKLFGRRVLVNYHSGEADDHLARSRIATSLLRRADALVVPSAYLVEVFRRHGLDAEAIANAVDMDRLPHRRRVRPRARFLGNRNFEALYNVPCLIKAFARIRSQHPDALLVLAGSGPQRPSLERLVDELRLRDAVTFTGKVTPGRMAELYEAADIYLNASNVDNMPLSILEAFACGLPVVSTDAGGIPHLVQHGRNGLLVEREDDVALAREALRLLEDSGLAVRLADAGYGDCRTRYSWEATEELWARAYNALHGRGR